MQAKNFNIWSRGAQKKAALQLAFSFGKYPLASGLRKFDMVGESDYIILQIRLLATKGKKHNKKIMVKIYSFFTRAKLYHVENKIQLSDC